MDPAETDDLLSSHHTFPGTYHIKAIGATDDEFERRVVAAAASELAGPSEVEYSIRETKGGRHVAVTLEITVQSPEQIRAVYAAIRKVDGLAYLL